MNKPFIIILLLILVAVFPSCDKNDPPLPDNLVAFSTNNLGFDEGMNELDVKISASRAVETATTVTVNLQATGVTYGTEFTTEPAATNNALVLNIPAGASEATIKVKKAAGVLLDGDEALQFTISSVGQPALPGEATGLAVSFSAITSTGSRLQLDGGAGAASAENTVFVDLSANRQTSVKRDDWDLGFYSGSGFRVIINNTNGASAIMVNKTDLNQVTSADIDPNALKLGLGSGSFSLFDDVSGDITKTVIPEIPANADAGKVFIINRKGGAGAVLPVEELYKIRVIRKDNGYTLQYAKINETSFKSLDVNKDNAYNFRYLSLVKGETITVEPRKDRWDFQWGWSMYYTGVTPYGFSDLVFINHLAGVQAVEVMTSTVSYEAFSEANLSGIVFSSSRDVIGSKWRVTTPASSAGVSTDRFYLIKDASGNIYKLKFISFTTNDGGTRGKPELEYALVKKGA